MELQNAVQNMSHTEAEMQQMHHLLLDLEGSMNLTHQLQEEVPAHGGGVKGRPRLLGLICLTLTEAGNEVKKQLDDGVLAPTGANAHFTLTI